MSLRLQRVRELLKREIGEVICRLLPVNEVGLINVNDVDVAPNLHNATVYIGVLGGEAQKKRAMEALEENRKRIQGYLGKAVVLKYTPHLRFILDESVERGNKILRLLDELETPQESSSDS
jgi:ribosome-binding factor A